MTMTKVPWKRKIQKHTLWRLCVILRILSHTHVFSMSYMKLSRKKFTNHSASLCRGSKVSNLPDVILIERYTFGINVTFNLWLTIYKILLTKILCDIIVSVNQASQFNCSQSLHRNKVQKRFSKKKLYIDTQKEKKNETLSFMHLYLNNMKNLNRLDNSNCSNLVSLFSSSFFKAGNLEKVSEAQHLWKKLSYILLQTNKAQLTQSPQVKSEWLQIN